MAAEKVRIVHPTTGHESEVSRSAFERRSSKLGWVLADSHPGEARFHNPGELTDTFSAPVTPGSADEREILVAEAEALGLKVHHRAKPETIRRQIDKRKAEAGL
jgi:hypothetical protein